ncbi:MAG: 4Fe-4S dicluster domain-containing protein [Anaerovoracaceae bacterium]|jgi:2-oxoglutarate ferredoxin oxidoreductase subunit delta
MKISIDKNLCKGCGICLEICPKKVYGLSQKRNSYGSPMPEAVSESECIVCRLCERLCPDAAINVEEGRK